MNLPRGLISRLALQAALGQEAQPLARHKQSSGLLVPGLGSSPYESTAVVLDVTSGRSRRFLHDFSAFAEEG
jgi:hypothetical protein